MDAKKGGAAGGCAKIVLTVAAVFAVFAVAVTAINFAFDIEPGRVSNSAAVVPPAKPAGDAHATAKPAREKIGPAPGEINALAVETVAFIDQSKKTIGFALQAQDGVAVRDDVELPAWKMLMRWNAYDYRDYYAYEACYDALQSLHDYADKMTAKDSADRRRSLEHDGERLETLLPKCRHTVDSNGRIRSDE